MIFINALLLGGVAAASIPLIIHLLNRTRFKMVDWGAMHLLESAIKLNTRRVQWQALLLLLLRMAIPAVLALCLARPVLTAWRTAAGGNHSVVMIIDNSLSMEAPAAQQQGADPSAAPQSCFQSAIAQAQSLVAKFGPATEITVLSAGGGVVDQTSGATFDSARVARRLREVTVGAGPAAIEESLASGIARLAKAKQPRRHLILLSDFQRTQWDNVTPDSLTALRASAQSGPTPIEVTFIPIESRSAENVSVQIDRPLGPSVVTGRQTLEVRVAVRNHGRQRVKDLPVVLSADGQALATKNVEVAGDSQIFLAFTCQLQTLGTHVLSVAIGNAARAKKSQPTSSPSIDPANPVSGDDVSRWSVEVIQPVRIGIVTTRPVTSKSIDDAAYLNLALSPFAVSLLGAAMSEETAGWAEAHAGADPIECEIAGPQELTAKWLSEHQAVALMNIPQLEDVVAERLSQFVQAGGMLMIWAGDGQDIAWYNRTWGSSARVPLLGAEYGELSRKADRTSPVLKIQNQAYEHPALTFFNRSSNGRLDSVEFNTWRRLTPATGSLTLLALENGDPLLVERSVGDGRVLQWAIQAGQRWSNLPLREVFVPLVQQLVLYGATSSMPRLNMETGSTLAIALPKVDAKQSTNSSPSSGEIQLLTPAGLRFQLEPQLSDQQATVQFASTNFPGAYQLSGVREKPLAIAVSAPAGESILEPLDAASMQEWASRLEAQIQTSAEAFWESELIKQTGREIWRWLLAALVLFLFAELLLQQSLTRTPT